MCEINKKKTLNTGFQRLNVYKFPLPLSYGIGHKQKIMVSKTMFKNTFSTGNTFIQCAIDKHDENTGTCTKDVKGFHPNHSTII